MSRGQTRPGLLIAVEQFALYARYIIFVVLSPLFFIRPNEGELKDVVGAGIVLFLHNAFVHWVLQTKRYHLFLSWQNIVLYVAEATYIAAISGSQRSEAYLLYIFIIIGAGAYSRNMRTTLFITGLCCASLLGVFVYGSFSLEQTELLGVMGAKLAGVLTCGWLVGVAARQAAKLEDDTLEKSAALEESERILRTILDSTADPIVVFDNNEFIVHANEAACGMLKVDRGEIAGRRIRAFFFDDGTLPTKFSSLRRHGSYSGEQIILDSLGEERNTELLVRRFMRADAPYFVALLHDVTERKNLQEVTRLANVQLERLNRELRHVGELKTGILRTMSQRLLSPLTPLLGYLQMLLDEELGEITPEQRKALQGCRRSALRVARIAEQSLAVGGQQMENEELPQAAAGNGADSDPFPAPTRSSETPAP